MHVLIIDADSVFCSIMERKLARQGHTATSVFDGQAGIDYLVQADRLPDILLLSVVMPKLSGWEVRQKQQANPRLAHIPVVFTSGDDPDDRDLAKSLDGQYLPKPYSQEEFNKLFPADP